MSYKTKRLLYILLCVAALGVLTFLFITETPEDMRTLGKFAVVTAGIVFSLFRILLQGGKDTAERETLYRESYKKLIEGAFTEDRKAEKRFFSALDDYNQEKPAKALKKLGKLRKSCSGRRELFAIASFEALCLDNMRCYEAALEKYSEARRLYPNANISSNMGHCFQRLGDPVSAGEYYREAAAIDPENPLPLINLAHLHVRLGEYAEGLHCAEEALALNPLDPRALKAAAICCYLAGDLEAYQSYYRRAVANGVDGKELSRLYIEGLAEALADMDANS